MFGSTYSGASKANNGASFIIGRVKSIITNLDPRPAQLNSSLVANVPQLSNERLETPPRKDLGRITFTPLYSNTNISLGDGITRGAYPIFNFIKQYPVLHEIVYIIPGPDSDLNDNVDAQSYYYFPPYSIWNFPNHGGFPNLEEAALYYQQQTNETAGRGLNMPINRDVRSTKDRKMSPLYYGNTFVENTFVKSLKPQEGDIIIEGRHGQSIRFGSTNKFDKITPKNEWSIGNSNAGDPITIIRNGQNYDTNYQGLHEESAKDHTTIWMTSTQDLSKIISISEFPLNSYGITAQDIQDAEGRITQLTDMPNYNPWNSAEQNDNYTSTSNYASNDKFGMESGQ